jgi:hypothetical protein
MFNIAPEGPVKFKVKPTCIKKLQLKKSPSEQGLPLVKRTFSLKNLNNKNGGCGETT